MIERLVNFFKRKLPGKPRVECDLCDSQDVRPPRTCCDTCLMEIGQWLELRSRVTA